jgi:dTDP-4-dehydrorhamnose 3,5-epimerase
MNIIKTDLQDCFIIEPVVFDDGRGCFSESFNQKVFKEKTGLDIQFVQDNQSTSEKGVLRGLHLQKGEFSQAKLVRVIQGKILDVVVDVRENSPTFGQSFSCILSGKNNKQIFIPKHFLHGFSVLEDNTIFAYKCDNYYHKDAEDGVIFNDQDIYIDWGLSDDEIIISEKDKKLKTFKDFKI